MFEEINENGYAVVFAEAGNAKGDVNLFIQLFDRVLNICPNLLVIVDDVHKSGGELFFQLFNRFERKNHYNIRFLFAARRDEFDIAKKTIVDWKLLQEIEDAIKGIKKSFTINFEKDDAILYLTQAILVTYSGQAAHDIKEVAEEMYNYSNGDPFMFAFAIRYYLLEDRSEAFNFIEADIRKKIESLDVEEELWKTALLCSFMGMFGLMHITIGETSLHSRKILLDCNICQDFLEYLSMSSRAILFKEAQEREYTIRHAQWALEFLTYIYGEDFDSYINQVFETCRYELDHLINIKELIRNGVKQIISCILNNIDINDLLTVIHTCSSLYSEYNYGRYNHLCDLIIDNYVVSDKLKNQDKPLNYYIALGHLYNSKKDYKRSFEFLDKAIEIDQNNELVWNNKGYALSELRKYEEAITCLDKALEIDPKFINALGEKGFVLGQLQKYEEAIQHLDKATELKPEFVSGWENKGYALDILGKYEKAMRCYDKALEIDPNSADIWYNRARANVKEGNIDNGIADLKKAIELGKQPYAEFAKKDKDFESIIDDYRFKKLISTSS